MRAAYFGFVFGADFVLETIRVLWIAPRVGVRTAELMEAPIMLVVLVAAARFLTQCSSLSRSWADTL